MNIQDFWKMTNIYKLTIWEFSNIELPNLYKWSGCKFLSCTQIWSTFTAVLGFFDQVNKSSKINGQPCDFDVNISVMLIPCLFVVRNKENLKFFQIQYNYYNSRLQGKIFDKYKNLIWANRAKVLSTGTVQFLNQLKNSFWKVYL